jgi:hypothetical protein
VLEVAEVDESLINKKEKEISALRLQTNGR